MYMYVNCDDCGHKNEITGLSLYGKEMIFYCTKCTARNVIEENKKSVTKFNPISVDFNYRPSLSTMDNSIPYATFHEEHTIKVKPVMVWSYTFECPNCNTILSDSKVARKSGLDKKKIMDTLYCYDCKAVYHVTVIFDESNIKNDKKDPTKDNKVVSLEDKRIHTKFLDEKTTVDDLTPIEALRTAIFDIESNEFNPFGCIVILLEEKDNNVMFDKYYANIGTGMDLLAYFTLLLNEQIDSLKDIPK